MTLFLYCAALPEAGFSYLVWNDLVEKVAEVRKAAGYGDWHKYSNLGKDKCKMSSGDTLSAKKYNEVRYNIGSVESTGWRDEKNGNQIFGEAITRIASAINRAIGS